MRAKDLILQYLRDAGALCYIGKHIEETLNGIFVPSPSCSWCNFQVQGDAGTGGLSV